MNHLQPTPFFLTSCLQVQSQLIWGIKDKLKKNCSSNDMKELLIANSQEVPSGESNVRLLLVSRCTESLPSPTHYGYIQSIMGHFPRYPFRSLWGSFGECQYFFPRVTVSPTTQLVTLKMLQMQGLSLAGHRLNHHSFTSVAI